MKGIATLLLAACSGGAQPSAVDRGTLAARCGRLIDGVGDGARADVMVLIRGGRIEAVGPEVRPPAGVELLDLSQHTCLPGLIDVHTHLTDEPADQGNLQANFTRTEEEVLRRGRLHAEATVLAGFTTVRDVGAYIGWTDRALRDTIARGEAVGPRMQVAGYYLTIPGGGGDLLLPGVAEKDIPPRVRMGVARGAEAFRAKAKTAVAGGADVLKVIASGAVLAYGGVPVEAEMTPEEIAAVVEVAHAAGKRVAAHAHGARSIKEAIRAGADTIEHASLIDDEGIALARARGVALSMDIYNGDYIDAEGRRNRLPQEFLDKNLQVTETQRRAFERAHGAGAIIVFGSDAATIPHGTNAKQFALMVKHGMTPMEAIRAATSVAAKAIGWEDRVGALIPGRFGDLIAVRGDPLADVRALEKVEVVVKGGKVLKR